MSVVLQCSYSTVDSRSNMSVGHIEFTYIIVDSKSNRAA